MAGILLPERLEELTCRFVEGGGVLGKLLISLSQAAEKSPVGRSASLITCALLACKHTMPRAVGCGRPFQLCKQRSCHLLTG